MLWVANAGEDSVSKIGTDIDKEVARYSSAFWKGGIGGNGAGLPTHDAWTGPAPSRSAVDSKGRLFTAGLGNGYQRRFDTNNANIQSSYYIEYGYGMAIGKDQNGVEKVIFAHHNLKGAGVMNPDTLQTTYPLQSPGLHSYGISFDKGGQMMLSAGKGYSTQGASNWRTDGSLNWTRPPQAGCATGGVCTTGTPHDQSGRGSVIVDSGVKYTVCK